jgi:hypothetical protein
MPGLRQEAHPGMTKAKICHHSLSVMRGLDSRIHHSSEDSCEGMDCRVKPGNGASAIREGENFFDNDEWTRSYDARLRFRLRDRRFSPSNSFQISFTHSRRCPVSSASATIASPPAS